jgi:hypothetical protein
MQKNAVKKLPFFFHTHPHTPPAAAPSTADCFDSRLDAHDVGNDSTMTIDGTDFRIPQKGIAIKGNAFASSEVQNKMILMGHQISSCHAPVVGSFFIFQKIILSS